MAIDTRNKRSSALGVNTAWRHMLPAPDGTIAQADRQAVALMYSGIAAANLTVPLGPFDYTRRYYDGYVDTRLPPPKQRLRGRVGRQS